MGLWSQCPLPQLLAAPEAGDPRASGGKTNDSTSRASHGDRALGTSSGSRVGPLRTARSPTSHLSPGVMWSPEEEGRGGCGGPGAGGGWAGPGDQAGASLDTGLAPAGLDGDASDRAVWGRSGLPGRQPPPSLCSPPGAGPGPRGQGRCTDSVQAMSGLWGPAVCRLLTRALCDSSSRVPFSPPRPDLPRRVFGTGNVCRLGLPQDHGKNCDR